MATTIENPALVRAADRVLIGARKGVMRAQLFTADLSGEFLEPGLTVKVPVIAPGVAAEYDEATGYEADKGSVVQVPVTLNKHPVHTMLFKQSDALAQDIGPLVQRAADVGGIAISNYIQEAIVAALAGASGSASAEISKAGLAALRKKAYELGSVPSDTVLLLAPGDYAAVLALFDSAVYGDASAIRDGVFSGSLFGFKAVAEVSSLTDGTGYLVPADQLLIAARAVPVNAPEQYAESGTTTDDETGLSITVRRHGTAKNDYRYVSVEALFGIALVDAAKVAKVTITAAE